MNNHIFSKKLKAFSLFEMLVIIGILLIVTVLVLPTNLQQNQKAKLESYARQLTTDLYYQQQRSFLRGIPTGIDIRSNGYTIFDGESLSTASESDYKRYPANVSITSINLSLGDEILFPSGKFKPSVYGSLVITDGSASVLVFINREGLIEYEIL